MATLGSLFQYDGSGMVDAIQGIRRERKQSALAKMLGEAYNAPEDQRQGILARLIGEDADFGLRAAKTLDPRFNPTQAEQFTLGPGAKRFGADGKVIAEVPYAPDKPEQPKYDLREIGGKMYYIPSNPMLGGQPQAQQTQNTPTQNAGFDAFIGGLMKREGGYVANDAGAGPTNFGINSRANPDVDVRSLTPERAQQLYKERYWDAIGADSLPPELQNAAFDAAVNMGPGKARELLAASGGDPARFDQLRMQHYQTLAQQNPQKYGQYLQSWQQRVADTAAMPANDTAPGMGMGMGAGMGFGVDPQAAGLPPGAIPVPGLPDMPAQQGNAPSGYSWNPDGSLSPIPGGPADRKNSPTNSDMARGEMGMRKELQDRIKQDRSVLSMYTNVQNAAKSGTAAADLSMIFAYMKMLDPGSVVREQEFANAQNAAGIPDRILNVRNQILSGNRLNPKQRAEFTNEARQLANEAQHRITSGSREYQGIAEQYGYDPVRATGQADFRNVQGASSAPRASQPIGGPKPGQVEDGYRYTGGDPANPKSWVKI